MESREKEVKDGFKWLFVAGSAAVILSVVLFWADNSVMGGASARDRAHNEELRQLRLAQSALPAHVTDERQTLPLSIEGGADSSAVSEGSH